MKCYLSCQGRAKQNLRRGTHAKLDLEDYLKEVWETGQFNPTKEQIWLNKEWFPTKVTVYNDYIARHNQHLASHGLDPSLPQNAPASLTQFYK